MWPQFWSPINLAIQENHTELTSRSQRSISSPSLEALLTGSSQPCYFQWENLGLSASSTALEVLHLDPSSLFDFGSAHPVVVVSHQWRASPVLEESPLPYLALSSLQLFLQTPSATIPRGQGDILAPFGSPRVTRGCFGEKHVQIFTGLSGMFVPVTSRSPLFHYPCLPLDITH